MLFNHVSVRAGGHLMAHESVRAGGHLMAHASVRAGGHLMAHILYLYWNAEELSKIVGLFVPLLVVTYMFIHEGWWSIDGTVSWSWYAVQLGSITGIEPCDWTGPNCITYNPEWWRVGTNKRSWYIGIDWVPINPADPPMMNTAMLGLVWTSPCWK
ncbi:hypothetical protein FRX31_008202 [Thalictrum thalictroides]|uniref:Uncharacterized protein n=1 Tax=Thalictrum thalictroides TaxID=46969 RepID=A0A7J6WXN4_THATH|nr:hypothetical protein FRX31_008202 [Thalictrum thalictroides]